MLLTTTIIVLFCLVAAQQQTWNISTSFHELYHPLSEINAFLDSLQHDYADHVRPVVVGWSSEGREVRGVVVGKNGSSAMLVLGAQHARDWIATSTALFLAHQLALRPIPNWSVHILPTPNPDGYVYTWDHDRFYYKNRQPSGPCLGIDMNRNWGYKFKHSKGCDNWYPGTRPFESPETNAIANYAAFINPNRARDSVFIDLRSYGQSISPPYSYSCKRTPRDAEDQLEAALGASRALAAVHHTPFTVAPLCETLYRAPGNVVDWMYKVAGYKFSYAVHLRDTGTFGYVLPPEWIVPTGEETMAMLLYLARWVGTHVH